MHILSHEKKRRTAAVWNEAKLVYVQYCITSSNAVLHSAVLITWDWILLNTGIPHFVFLPVEGALNETAVSEVTSSIRISVNRSNSFSQLARHWQFATRRVRPYWNKTNDWTYRVPFNSEALKGVAIYLHSLILSLFFKIDRTINSAKSHALHTPKLVFTSRDIPHHC